jgi:hypothetical protein
MPPMLITGFGIGKVGSTGITIPIGIIGNGGSGFGMFGNGIPPIDIDGFGIGNGGITGTTIPIGTTGNGGNGI